MQFLFTVVNVNLPQRYTRVEVNQNPISKSSLSMLPSRSSCNQLQMARPSQNINLKPGHLRNHDLTRIRSTNLYMGINGDVSNPSKNIITNSNVLNNQLNTQPIQNPKLFESSLSENQMKIVSPGNDYPPQVFAKSEA